MEMVTIIRYLLIDFFALSYSLEQSLRIVQMDIWLYKCPKHTRKLFRSSYIGTLAARSLVARLQREMHEGQSIFREEIHQTLQQVASFHPPSVSSAQFSIADIQNTITYHFKTYPKELINYE